MSHEFESGFFTHTPAWHKLGTVLEEPPTIQEGLIAAGLDWGVKEAPLQALDCGGERILDVPRHKALLRETDNSVLGVVGQNYVPLQNIEAFQWFDFLLHEGDATLEAAGSLKEGRIVWVLAKLRETGEVGEGDEIRSYVLLSNSHDGSRAVTIGFTPIRVVCWNTLSMAHSHLDSQAEKGLRKQLSFKHTTNVREQMDFAKSVVDLSSQSFSAGIESFRALANRQCSSILFEEYVSQVFGVEKPKEDLRAFCTLQELFEDGRGANLPKVRGTLWGAYNAITEFVDHTRGRTEETRLEAAWFGAGKVTKEKAHEVAVSFL